MLLKIFKYFYLVYIILFCISWYMVKTLPPVEDIVPQMFYEPIQQEDTTKEKFEFEYRNRNYSVRPIADYELWGLVVTQNDIGIWYNYYHDNDSVNLRDVCVVWGENVKDGAYSQKNLKFQSGEYTCYIKRKGIIEKPFFGNKLSNNHLLSDNEQVRKIVRNINIGDQIHVKGTLVDYAEVGKTAYRKTSISRDDINETSRSGGACEVFFIDEIEVLKQHQLYWNYFYRWRWRILFMLLIINLAIFLINDKKMRKLKQLELE